MYLDIFEFIYLYIFRFIYLDILDLSTKFKQSHLSQVFTRRGIEFLPQIKIFKSLHCCNLNL